MRRFTLTLTLAALIAPAARADDWPMWGGRPDRNMVSTEKGVPFQWEGDGKKQLRWAAELGNNAWGGVVVAGGRAFVGTNNEHPRDPAVKGDKGIFMCFDVKSGDFLWQAVHEKLPGGTDVDHEHQGVCAGAAVAGDRVYYVNNRAELVCLDVQGFADGENDGVQDETRKGPKDADVVWILDFRALGVWQYQASASTPLVVDGRLFLVTGQAVEAKSGKVPKPEAPSFVCVEAATGRILWQDASPGDRIKLAQWGSPAYGVVEGKPQVVFPGGDRWLYSFDPATGRLLWKFNMVVHEAGAEPPKVDSILAATPVFAGHRVLCLLSQYPDSGENPGCIRAIDARKSGDVTGTAELWRLAGPGFTRSLATPAIRDGLVYVAEEIGYLNCIEFESGRRLWRHDLKTTVWGSPLVADGKVYVQTADGELVVFQAGREEKRLAVSSLPGLSNGTPVISNGTLYLVAPTKLYAVGPAR